MSKKIISITILIMFLLLGLTTVTANTIKKNNNETKEKNDKNIVPDDYRVKISGGLRLKITAYAKIGSEGETRIGDNYKIEWNYHRISDKTDTYPIHSLPLNAKVSNFQLDRGTFKVTVKLGGQIVKEKTGFYWFGFFII